MGLAVRRIAGDNRFATAVAIAQARGYGSSADTDTLVLAEQGGRDDVWAPGFASSAFGSTSGAPVLLTDGPTVPAETLEFVMAGVPDNLTDGGPGVVCATFVDPIACQAVALLLIGNLTDVLDLLGGLLAELPLIGDVLAALGLQGLLPADLQAVVDGLLAGGLDPALLTDLLGGLATDDPAAVLDGLGGSDALLAGITGGDLLGGQTDGLPLLGDLLTVLGAGGDLPTSLQTVVDDLFATGAGFDQVSAVLQAILGGDDAALLAALTDIVETTGETLDQLVNSLLGTDDGTTDDGTLIDDVIGILDGGLLDGSTDDGTTGDGGLIGDDGLLGGLLSN
jgi:hypothetical protein